MQDSDSQGANAKRLEGETTNAKKSIDSSIASKKQEVCCHILAAHMAAMTRTRLMTDAVPAQVIDTLVKYVTEVAPLELSASLTL